MFVGRNDSYFESPFNWACVEAVEELTTTYLLRQHNLSSLTLCALKQVTSIGKDYLLLSRVRGAWENPQDIKIIDHH